MLASHPRDSYLIDLVYGLGIRSFKTSPEDSNVQPRLGVCVLEPHCEELLCLKETKQRNTQRETKLRITKVISTLLNFVIQALLNTIEIILHQETLTD